MLCQMTDCKHKVSPIIGDCKYCDGHFCSYHRLPEVHQCHGLEKCKREHFDRNRTKLMNEKTVPNQLIC